MIDDALLHARPDGGLGTLAIGGLSQRLFLRCSFTRCSFTRCPFLQRPFSQYLFRDGERIFRRGVIALLRRVCLLGFLSVF